MYRPEAEERERHEEHGHHANTENVDEHFPRMCHSRVVAVTEWLFLFSLGTSVESYRYRLWLGRVCLIDHTEVAPIEPDFAVLVDYLLLC